MQSRTLTRQTYAPTGRWQVGQNQSVEADSTQLMHWALDRNDLSAVESLLRGGTPLLPNEAGHHPIHLAILKDNLPMLRLLFTIINVDGNMTNPATGLSALQTAASIGNREMLRFLLGQNANVNQQDSMESFTPLHLAAQHGHNQSARILIYAGCDVNAANRYGDTALHTATRYGHTAIVRMLLATAVRVEAVNKNLDNALHIATSLRHLPIARLLVEANGEIRSVMATQPISQPLDICQMRNAQNETPIEVAQRKQFPEFRTFSSRRDPSCSGSGSASARRRNRPSMEQNPTHGPINSHPLTPDSLFRNKTMRSSVVYDAPFISMDATRQSVSHKHHSIQPEALLVNDNYNVDDNCFVGRNRIPISSAEDVACLEDSGLPNTPVTDDPSSGQNDMPNSADEQRFTGHVSGRNETLIHSTRLNSIPNKVAIHNRPPQPVPFHVVSSENRNPGIDGQIYSDNLPQMDRSKPMPQIPSGPQHRTLPMIHEHPDPDACLSDITQSIHNLHFDANRQMNKHESYHSWTGTSIRSSAGSIPQRETSIGEVGKRTKLPCDAPSAIAARHYATNAERKIRESTPAYHGLKKEMIPHQLHDGMLMTPADSLKRYRQHHSERKSKGKSFFAKLFRRKKELEVIHPSDEPMSQGFWTQHLPLASSVRKRFHSCDRDRVQSSEFPPPIRDSMKGHTQLLHQVPKPLDQPRHAAHTRLYRSQSDESLARVVSKTKCDRATEDIVTTRDGMVMRRSGFSRTFGRRSINHNPFGRK